MGLTDLLRALAEHKHDDHKIALEAADKIEEYEHEIDRLNTLLSEIMTKIERGQRNIIREL